MITPRTTRLLRVHDLGGMQRTIVEITRAPDPLAARACAVIVPTRGAAEALRRTLEHLALSSNDGAAWLLPDLLTRGELYTRLHAALRQAPPVLSAFEREVLFRRAARLAAAGGAPAPFRLRPGLIVEILAFYDELRRRDRTVSDFDRLMTESLAPSVDVDRGAERMLRQTRFLTAAFTEFEQAIAASGRIDEHGLRAWLLDRHEVCGYRHVIVTVGDQAADRLGLWTADFDLLARVDGLERLDVVATEHALAAGLHQRIHDLLPGIEEERCGEPSPLPVLAVPQPHVDAPAVRYFVSRDREEELADVARLLKPRRESFERTAVVFQRPLPYLYLARHVLADAGVPYHALDALPLAAEPFAAALDLVFSFAIADATRASAVDLLGSPHWRFVVDDCEVARAHVVAMDRLLRELKYLGGRDRLQALLSEGLPQGSGRRADLLRRAWPALRAAEAVALELGPLAEGSSATGQVRALRQFITAHERLPLPSAVWYDRHQRARAAVLGALDALAAAHQRHDDDPVPLPDFAATLRRWIEGQTFSPRTGTTGVALLDAVAAAYADPGEIRLVGLVESDWPERSTRNIFYPASLLSQLGWPVESDRLAAARARFRDLVRLARDRISISTFSLEDDAIVSPSPFLEELDGCGLSIDHVATTRAPRIFVHEALSEEPIVPAAARGAASAWLALRSGRSPADAAMYRGSTGPRPPGAYAVSQMERYLECPFKYFAAHVLRLDEERPEESGLSPQERGQLLHEVFERFFARWQAEGNLGISAENLPRAIDVFAEVAETVLSRLSEADRALERTYLLGSAAAAGLAERAFAFEIEHGVGVVERLLEYQLEGEFEFVGPDGPRRVRIRAKADRIDLLDDGTLRVIDYKLSRPPRPARALQLPVYGVCAAQHLERRDGRPWPVSRAGYVAFRDKNPFVPLGGSSSLDRALEEGQRRLLDTVDRIERGEFPVDPAEPYFCTRCGYAPVCRKDYVGDE